MSETEEMSTTSPEEFVNKKELDLAVNNAVVEIKRNEADPVAKAGTAATELGMMAALGETAKSYLKDTVGVYWKDTKVGVMSFLGIVPFARELSAPAKAIRQADKVAYYGAKAGKELATTSSGEKALRAIGQLNELSGAEAQLLQQAVDAFPKGSAAAVRLEEALRSGYGAREAFHFAQHGLPPKNIVEKAVQGVKHHIVREIPHYLDPFPDVPDAVKKVTGALDLVSFGSTLVALFPPATPIAAPVAAVTGIIGVGVPAAWQYIHNRLESMRVGLKYGKEVAGIVSHAVSKKLSGEKSPEAQKAASAFAIVNAASI